MVSKFIIIISLVQLVAGASFEEKINGIKHVHDGDDYMVVTTAEDNFAANGPELKALGWATVNVNHGEINVITQECESLSRLDLKESELEKLASFRGRLHKFEIDKYHHGSPKYWVARYTFGPPSEFSGASSVGYQSKNFLAKDINFEMYGSSEYSVAKIGDVGTVRVFVQGDIVTFVSASGDVDMKPIKCFSGAEKTYFEQIQLALRAKRVDTSRNV